MTLSALTDDMTGEVVLRVQQVMQESIKVMGAVIRKRDPYTALHQARVASLSTAIAAEMHFPQDMIVGLGLASEIHDIGKLFIPMDILSKSGMLSDWELEIIRDHPRVAGDILTNMEFSWPVGAIVCQHHERLDGSGYPQGLRGEDILPEARVLAVADVVEAMSFDRPYRLALGTGAAVAEVELGSGRLYDAQVVTACTRLFRENRFEFQNF